MAERAIIPAAGGPGAVAATGGPAPVVSEGDDQIVRLEAEIALKRQRVASSLGELRRRVHTAISWRHWAGAHPVAWIGLGVCLGFVCGLRGARNGARRPSR